jgi:AraC family transcriptional regulator of adaptative response/methylated-DNA-[protein]-cysteine methyltransferase
MKYRYFDTPIGEMIAVGNEEGICLLEFRDKQMLDNELKALKQYFQITEINPGSTKVLDQLSDELMAYFQKTLKQFTVPIIKWGTPFQNKVWGVLEQIEYGQLRSYGQIASEINKPTASRAVGMANGKNKIAIIIPCHRVIGSKGELTGYAGGLWRKEWLIAHEQSDRP